MSLDLLVAGGGPIGLATAILARQAGMTVAVKEPRVEAHDKACGEGLMPAAVEHLHALGVHPEGIDFHGIRYSDGTASVAARFAQGSGLGVRRTHLHEVMHERATELGVQFVDGRVGELVQSADAIESDGLRSRYLVAADGLHSALRSSLGLSRVSRGVRRYGLRQHFRIEPWTDLVEVHWLDSVEVYVTPVAPDCVGVAVLGERPLDHGAAVRAVAELDARLYGAPAASRILGAGPLRQRTSRRTSGRAVLVGDAAGYVDALTGEGLRIGLAEAAAAVSAMVEGDLSAYERDWRSITRSYRQLTTGLVWAASQPVLRTRIVPLAAAMPWAFGRIVSTLGS
jgi:flavin-dependent dehydrogenase